MKSVEYPSKNYCVERYKNLPTFPELGLYKTLLSTQYCWLRKTDGYPERCTLRISNCKENIQRLMIGALDTVLNLTT